MDMTVRPRRLRTSETLRKMVRETRVDAASLVYPIFVMEGKNKKEEQKLGIWGWSQKKDADGNKLFEADGVTPQMEAVLR
ncbi:MAG: porphobilinogen synthase, partial [Lachnospiraceae bacterium]|nr:porphobilinogen synthase [Lachnospiraceae bacterium]